MTADEGLLHYSGFNAQQKEIAKKLFTPVYVNRPAGSNADEWHMFLSEHKDALGYVAVQIAEAIEEAERRGPQLPGHDETMKNLDALTIRKPPHPHT